MNIVPFPRHLQNTEMPLLALVDLQLEYVAEGRAHFLTGAAACLENCEVILNAARQIGMPIAHFRLLGRGHFFNSATGYAGWVEKFRPRANEHVFEREKPSCYSNVAYCKLLAAVEHPTVIYIGVVGERACLSTAVDGHHRGDASIFVRDCSASGTLGRMDEKQSHAMIFEVISLYAQVADLGDVLPILMAGRTSARGV
jgi:nicotinamidase-related amidase